MSVTILLVMIVVITLALVLLIMWDRLLGTALVGIVAGATWSVAQSEGRWWFWPMVVVAAVGVTAAFVVAVLIS